MVLMSLFVLRASLILFTAFAVGIGLLHALQYDPARYADARAFLTVSQNCEAAPCFLGVIPGQTPALEINERLLASEYVEWAELVDIRTRFDHVNWRWSGAQPRFVQLPGRIDISPADTAGWITLLPELTLAELLLILGEPQSVGGRFSEVLLRYPQYGFLVRFAADCPHFWHTQVEIEIHPLRDSVSEATLDARHRELCALPWP